MTLTSNMVPQGKLVTSQNVPVELHVWEPLFSTSLAVYMASVLLASQDTLTTNGSSCWILVIMGWQGAQVERMKKNSEWIIQWLLLMFTESSILRIIGIYNRSTHIITTYYIILYYIAHITYLVCMPFNIWLHYLKVQCFTCLLCCCTAVVVTATFATWTDHNAVLGVAPEVWQYTHWRRVIA